MPGLLRNVPITDEQRRRNDTHRPLVVVTVLLFLCVYMYLFTQIAQPLGLPLPADLAAEFGVSSSHIFDNDRNLDSNVYISQTRLLKSDDERLLFYLILSAAFLCAYFLPLAYKQPSLVFWTAAAVMLLYGPKATAALMFAHILLFLVLHSGKRRHLVLSAVAGLLAYWAFVEHPRIEPLTAAMYLAGLPALCLVLYRYVVLRLLALPRVAPVLRTVTVQSAILSVCILAIAEGLSGDEWALPLGVLLFFWQWERLIMYHLDYKDGHIPDDIKIGQYLAVFWNPGVVPNWTWGVSIGQGYAYANNNFLCEDKNRLVLSGLKLWAIALFYLVFADSLIQLFIDIFNQLDIPVHRARTKTLARHFLRGHEIDAASVLVTTMLDLVRWTMLWAGVVHFKVGIWRICGYRMDPYIHRPWASTNMVVLWTRFTYHYREFLVRAFYYPVFFRFFKKRRYLRVFVATMAAAGMGNMVWGHVTEGLFYRGLEFDNILAVLRTWPYFLLLGLGISFSAMYLMWRKRTRKPWTLDRWLITDIAAVYITLQYYALIRIFSHPAPNGTIWDSCRLLLRGFGIHIE